MANPPPQGEGTYLPFQREISATQDEVCTNYLIFSGIFKRENKLLRTQFKMPGHAFASSMGNLLLQHLFCPGREFR